METGPTATNVGDLQVTLARPFDLAIGLAQGR